MPIPRRAVAEASPQVDLAAIRAILEASDVKPPIPSGQTTAGWNRYAESEPLDTALRGSPCRRVGFARTAWVAHILINGFSLDYSQAMPLFHAWNRACCNPPWPEDELSRRLRWAERGPFQSPSEGVETHGNIAPHDTHDNQVGRKRGKGVNSNTFADFKIDDEPVEWEAARSARKRGA